jgi:MULE transposase domain
VKCSALSGEFAGHLTRICWNLQVVLLLDDMITQSAPEGQYMASFEGRRKRLTIDDVNKIAKRVARESFIDANDVAMVNGLVQEMHLTHSAEDNPVLFYQPQKLGPDGEITQHFIIVLSNRFCLSMLNAFGTENERMILMDATGGTNKCGYPVYALLVVDDYREGVPVAFMVTSSQKADEIEVLLKASSLDTLYFLHVHACQHV